METKLANDLWATPQYIFDWLDEEFGFDIDVCADEDNAKCLDYIDKELDTLVTNWICQSVQAITKMRPVCWMNPPYSNPLPFVKKAYEESINGCTVVCLLPSDTSTKWFHEYVADKAEVRFVQGRIKFVNPETGSDTDQAPKFGSMIVIYGPNITPGYKTVKRPDKPKSAPK